MHINEYKLLSTRRYIPLLITQFGGAFNDHLLKVLLLVFVVQHMTHNTLVALATGAFLIPFLLFSQQAGVLADTGEKAHLITKIKIFEFLVALMMLTAVALDNVWLLLFATFALGTKVSYFLPLKHSILPQLVQVDELIAGNAFMAALTFASVFLAILLYLNYGVYPLAILMVIVAAIGWVSSLYVLPAPALTEDKLSYDFLSQSPIIIFTVVCIAWFWAVNYIYMTIVFDYCYAIFLDRCMLRTLATSYVGGAVLGSLIVNYILKSKITLKLILPSLVVMFLASADLYFASILQNTIRIFLDLFVIGLAAGIYIVPLYATLQHRSVPIFRARNIAVSSIMNAKSIILAFVILIILEHKHTYIVGSLLIIPVSALILLIYVLSCKRE